MRTTESHPNPHQVANPAPTLTDILKVWNDPTSTMPLYQFHDMIRRAGYRIASLYPDLQLEQVH